MNKTRLRTPQWHLELHSLLARKRRKYCTQDYVSLVRRQRDELAKTFLLPLIEDFYLMLSF